MVDSDLRPMSTSQLLDRTFQLYFRNFALLAGIAAPVAALGLIGRMAFNSGPGILTWPGTLLSSLGEIVMSVLTQAIASGATVYAVSAIHLGRNISISEIYSRLWLSLGSILRALLVINFRALWLFGLAAAIIGLSSIGGLSPLAILAFLVGIAGIPVSIITYLTYALAVPVCAVERLPARQALIRSRFLTDNSWGRIFLINLLAGIISAVVFQVLKLPTFLFDHFGYHLTAIFPAGLWDNLAEFLAEILAGPVAAIAIALLYYDQRVRKEAFDLQLMMESLVQPAVTKAPA